MLYFKLTLMTTLHHIACALHSNSLLLFGSDPFNEKEMIIVTADTGKMSSYKVHIKILGKVISAKNFA